MGNICCAGGGGLASIEIGKYTVREKERLGEGGFSFVNACVDVNVENKKYALKKMVCTDSESLDAAETEAKIMRGIGQHPNIVSLLDTAFVAGKNGAKDVFLLLEYCPIALQTLMNKRSLDDREILDILCSVCEALVHLHSQAPPIAHRDIKVENVLQGSDGKWKICDMGSCVTRARAYENKSEISREEDVIARTTTAQYRAPEMCDLYSRQVVNEKVDVWALGCMAYLLAFNRHAFPDGSALATLTGKYTIPPAHGRSQQLIDVINACLVLKPSERPSSSEVLRILQLTQVTPFGSV